MGAQTQSERFFASGNGNSDPIFLNENPCKPWAAVDIVENAILARLSKWLVKD